MDLYYYRSVCFDNLEEECLGVAYLVRHLVIMKMSVKLKVVSTEMWISLLKNADYFVLF
jgi:hypothetical protein